MICIPILNADRGDIQAAARLADLVELRVDYAPDADLQELLRDRPCPVIVTCRPVREGGQYDGDEAGRVAILQRAIDLGADYVDVELDSIGKIKRGGSPTKLIVSHHDFQRTPDDLPALHERLVATGADVAKFACRVTDIRDNLRILDVLRGTDHPTIALGMGEAGVVTRILGGKYGNFLTFASLDEGKESAPGQVTAMAMRDMYRYKNIGPDTAVYGVIANPVAHSMSPAILNAAFDAAGLDAVYLPFKVECDPVEFIEAFKALDVRGYSVTIPHKQSIIPAMDAVDELVGKVGALNTIVNRDGRLLGTNTDVPGAMRALEEAIGGSDALADKRVLLLGAGGAARALVYGLKTRGGDVVIANRTAEKAERLAKEMDCRCVPLDRVAEVAADVLINTTSVGMTPNVDASPFPSDALRPGMVVFDAVYNPLETKLLREAAARGCTAVQGIAWFVNQAAAQFELWTGQPAPRAVMERVLLERLAAGA